MPSTNRTRQDHGRDGWRPGRGPDRLPAGGRRDAPAADEGWMHNRVRMVVASFLIKDLHIGWWHGADWFMEHLHDGDIAQNQLNWQWVAGCGTDAAPYFRVFNPISQGEKFDPDGRYIRRYVPELADVPPSTCTGPGRPRTVRRTGYPAPIVDHAAERKEALRRYEDHALRALRPSRRLSQPRAIQQPGHLGGHVVPGGGEVPARIDQPGIWSRSVPHEPGEGGVQLGTDVDLGQSGADARTSSSSGTPEDPCSTSGTCTACRSRDHQVEVELGGPLGHGVRAAHGDRRGRPPRCRRRTVRLLRPGPRGRERAPRPCRRPRRARPPPGRRDHGSGGRLGGDGDVLLVRQRGAVEHHRGGAELDRGVAPGRRR